MEFILNRSGDVTETFSGAEIINPSKRSNEQFITAQVGYQSSSDTPYIVEMQGGVPNDVGQVTYGHVRRFDKNNENVPVKIEVSATGSYRFKYMTLQGTYNSNKVVIRLTG